MVNETDQEELRMRPKRPEESRTVLNHIIQPEHSNSLQIVHGATVMKLVDEAGSVAAMRHAGAQVVTQAIDAMMFLAPIPLGALITITSEVTWVGRSSIEVKVEVVVDSAITRQQTHTHSAYMVYVAVNEARRSIEVPRLILESDEEKSRWAEAEARKRRRYELFPR